MNKDAGLTRIEAYTQKKDVFSKREITIQNLLHMPKIIKISFPGV
jgi:hypothetical protein